MIGAVVVAAILTVTTPYPSSDPAPKARRIIEQTWPAHLVKAATSVAWCESRMVGNAKDYKTGTHRGLFQLGRREWAAHKPRPNADVYDRRDNSMAAYSLYLSRGWRPWVCRP